MSELQWTLAIGMISLIVGAALNLTLKPRVRRMNR
jgi:hypothetical protein